MIFRTLLLAGIAATSIGAQATLTTYQPWETAYTANGLSGVLFDVNSAVGVGTVALGAHAYKNGAGLANDGAHTFNALPGLYAPDGKNYANWSFDFGFTIDASCSNCKAFIGVDTDASAGVNMVYGDVTAFQPNPESWNMEMVFLPPFNPNVSSSTAFALEIRAADGTTVLTHSDITVNVPEPGSLALVGLALAGVAALRRRQA